MNWRELKSKKVLPGYPGRLLLQGLDNPLPQVLPRGPLHDLEIHHVAIAMSERNARRWSNHLKVRQGLRPVESFHLWPDEAPGCPKTSPENHTYMASFQADGFRVVLLAPPHRGCVVARFLRMAGEGLHHIAFQVTDIENSMKRLASAGLRQVTKLADHDPELKQVFYKADPDPRIIELVESSPEFKGTFTCRNLDVLIDGERRNAFADEAPIRPVVFESFSRK